MSSTDTAVVSPRQGALHKRARGAEHGSGRSRATASAVAERAARRVEQADAGELAHAGRARGGAAASALRDTRAVAAARASLRALTVPGRAAAARLRVRSERAVSVDTGERGPGSERRRWIALAVLCLG